MTGSAAQGGGPTRDPARTEAVLETDLGEMVVSFLPDQAPATVENFLALAGRRFYDGVTFHRIVRGFMVQGGCPEGTGTGGPGYTIKAEFNDTEHRRGVLSMARSYDPDSAGSQFFIVHGEHAAHLDGQYTAFGRVVEGLEVLDAIASVPVEFNDGGERSRPVEPVRIRRVVLREAAGDRGVGGTPGDEAGAGEGEASGA